jgi:hypothetical protein
VRSATTSNRSRPSRHRPVRRSPLASGGAEGWSVVNSAHKDEGIRGSVSSGQFPPVTSGLRSQKVWPVSSGLVVSASLSTHSRRPMTGAAKEPQIGRVGTASKSRPHRMQRMVARQLLDQADGGRASGKQLGSEAAGGELFGPD